MSTKLPTPEKLRELLSYDPDTGQLTWKPRTGEMSDLFNHNFAGSPAGTLRTDGYIAVKVSNVAYPAPPHNLGNGSWRMAGMRAARQS